MKLSMAAATGAGTAAVLHGGASSAAPSMRCGCSCSAGAGRSFASETGYSYVGSTAPISSSALLFATGSGISPIRSLIEAGFGADKRSDVRLYYGSRNLDRMAYQVPRKSFSFVPVLVTSPCNSFQIKRASVLDSPDSRRLGLLRHSNSRSHCRFSSTDFFVPKGTCHSRNRPSWLQTRAFQAVTADGDSSNGDGVESSNHAMNFSSLWSSQDVLRPFVASSLHGLQEGFRALKEKGLQSSKEGFGEAYSRLKTGDGKSLFENVRWSELATQGGRTWQSVEPWIKWPLAIFAGAFLAVWASCGMVVAQDLIPLWIIGPLITGSIIRSAYFIADLTQKGAASTKPLREAVMRGTVQLLEDAKNGELIDKLRINIEQKNAEWKEEAAKKRVDFALYVKSGQAASDFKVFLLLKFSQINDWSTERYEDFAEWARPYWRAFTRLMKKLF